MTTAAIETAKETSITIRVVLPGELSKETIKDLAAGLQSDYFASATFFEWAGKSEYKGGIGGFEKGQAIYDAFLGVDILRGTQTIRDACEFHRSHCCLDECTNEIHDDTCLVGIMDVVIPILEAEEVRNPKLAEPMVREAIKGVETK